MALSSTFWRLNLLSKPSVSLRALKPFKPKPRPMSSLPISSKSNSSNFSASKNPTFLDPKTRTPYPQHDLIVLGIETSCDDTAAAVVKSNGEILSQVISSQADLLAQYGGVASKMAEEAHLQVIDLVVQEALDKANLSERDLSAVAVTIGPGLSLCLLVGVRKAGKIAGGHNVLILARDLGHYVQLGTTIDDAIGEAYDKIAKWLGLDLRRSGGPATFSPHLSYVAQ